MKIWYPAVRGKYYEASLELSFDTVPKKTLLIFLQRIVRNPITYENAFPMKNREFLPEKQVNYVEDIIVKRDTENLRM